MMAAIVIIALLALGEPDKVLREPHNRTADPPKTFALEAIDEYVKAQVRDHGYAGLSLAIAREGKIVLAKGYGKRTIEEGMPVGPDTMFAVGSLTKQFTCACILLLAEEGKLSVDDKVAKYYPTLARANNITLYDLMAHTSGYPDYYPLDFVDRRLQKPIDKDVLLTEFAGEQARLRARREMVVQQYRVRAAGTGGRKGQRQTVRSVPRGAHPRSPGHDEFRDRHSIRSSAAARGYTSFALGPLEPAAPEADGWLSAAGNLWASASDVARWDLALVNGQLLKPASFRLMTSSRLLSNFKRTGYSCGLSLRLVEGETVLWHDGSISGFRSVNALVPSSRSALVLLQNSEHIDSAELHATILKLLIKDQAKPAPAAVPKVNGPAPKEAALDFLHQMQSGKLERAKLGEEFSVFLTDDRVKAAAPRLKSLGEPEKVEVASIDERGGMEVASIQFAFKTTKLHGLLYRTPDGKIQQLLFRACG